jgi:cell cycle checkpoint protein
MKRALQRLLSTRALSSHRKIKGKQPGKDMLDLVVETSNGDIRSAIMALQYICTTSSISEPTRLSGRGGKSDGKTGENTAQDSRALLEVTSRREQSLLLFHLLGKVLYNKRQ